MHTDFRLHDVTLLLNLLPSSRLPYSPLLSGAWLGVDCLATTTSPPPDQRRVVAAPEGVVFQGGEVFLAPDPAADFLVGGNGGS